MAETKDIGRLYFHTLTYPEGFSPPLWDTGTTREVDPPFRRGKARVIRLPFTMTCLVVGWWGRGRVMTEEQALLAALDGGRPEYTVEDIRTWAS